MNKMNLPAPFGAVTPTPPIVSNTVYNNHIILTLIILTCKEMLFFLRILRNVTDSVYEKLALCDDKHVSH